MSTETQHKGDTAMHWTNDRPRRWGWSWYKEDGVACVVPVTMRADGFYAWDAVNVENMPGHWSSEPIPEPDAQTDNPTPASPPKPPETVVCDKAARTVLLAALGRPQRARDGKHLRITPKTCQVVATAAATGCLACGHSPNRCMPRGDTRCRECVCNPIPPRQRDDPPPSENNSTPAL